MIQIKNVLRILFVVFYSQSSLSQDSKFLSHLVDSLPKGKPVMVNFKMEKGFMATERIAISKNGKTIYYGVRNGYDTISKAHILKIEFKNNKWSLPKNVFADSAGAPSLSRNEKIMYFQYDHPLHPKGVYSKKAKLGWTKPIGFLKELKKSHYLQAPKTNSYYYSAGTKRSDKIQDIYHVIIAKKDTIITPLAFNIKGDFIDFYVAKDESFIILLISKKKNADTYKFHSNTDMFISFKMNNDDWSLPVNLGKAVNGSVSPWNWAPYVTNDHKYLFFSSWPKKVGTCMIDFQPLLENAKSKLRID